MCLALSPVAEAATKHYRLIWNDDPATMATVAWTHVDGDDATLHYGDVDHGLDWEKYPVTKNVDRKTSHQRLKTHFVRLTELKPDSVVNFVIRSGNHVSPRFWFRTAPAENTPLTFVAGGDSRNHRDARQRANRSVAKLRPLFVCFGGDMIDRPVPHEWHDWFDDWQLTIAEDGRIFPIVAARGNHEHYRDVNYLFDTPNKDDYYAFSIGKKYLRLYTLNSNIVRGGAQGAWLASDLKANQDYTWKIAHYHHPFRPHTSGKKEQDAQYEAWASAFYDFGLNLAIECDSHTVKRTWPVRPSNEAGSDHGFIRDDERGTVFIGEGCWGAPLRPNDDTKAWTRDSASFNQVNWIAVTPEKLTARTIRVDDVDQFESVDDADPLTPPANLPVWEASNGTEVVIEPWK